MIHLEETEKQWIKLCKGHYIDEYPFTGSWVKTLIPLFKKIYGYDPADSEANYNSYLNCVFNKLLNIWMKIKDDQSGNEIQLRSIFSAAFYKSISREEESPIERAIGQLCGLIQGNQVLTTVTRYKLD